MKAKAALNSAVYFSKFVVYFISTISMALLALFKKKLELTALTSLATTVPNLN